MERTLGRGPAILLTIIMSVAAYVLRLEQLRTAFDAEGYVIAGTGKGFLTWFCLLMVVLFGVYSFLLTPRKKQSALHDRSPIAFGLHTAAAVAMAAGSVMLALELENRWDLLLGAGGVVAAIFWFVIGLERFRGRELPALLFMVPTVVYVVMLIYDFRHWSRDPQILDYCFDLLTMICVMCATFHLGGFSFDRGQRRLAAFFCFCGIFFGAAAIAGSDAKTVAMTGGAMLWMLANLCTLLRPARTRRRNQDEE